MLDKESAFLNVTETSADRQLRPLRNVVAEKSSVRVIPPQQTGTNNDFTAPCSF